MYYPHSCASIYSQYDALFRDEETNTEKASDLFAQRLLASKQQSWTRQVATESVLLAMLGSEGQMGIN